MTININWNLDCVKDTAIKLLMDAIDEPYKSNYSCKKSYKGHVSENSFTIWPKNPGLRGGPVANGKGKIIQNGNKSIIEAVIDITVPYRYLPSNGTFWWILTPITFLIWLITLLSTLSDDFRYLLPFFSPFTMLGLAVMVLGFMKYLGISDLEFIHKFLYNIYSSYIADNASEANQAS